MRYGAFMLHTVAPRILVAALCLALAGSSQAVAAAPGAGAPMPVERPQPKPWAKGVSGADQSKAQGLFAEGNKHFVAKDYAKALAKYEAAISSWDHPAIQYNKAVCLLELRRPLLAHKAINQALRFGKGPLSDRNFEEAQRYQVLLRDRLSKQTFKCQQGGAEVKLSGKPLMTCPRTVQKLLEPGEHVVVASAPGYKTSTLTVQAAAGVSNTVNIVLKPQTRLEERYPLNPAIPWSVFGGGLVIAAVGIPMQLMAQSSYDDYDDILRNQCPPGGCPASELPADAVAARDSGDTTDAVGIAMYAVGGAAVVAGIVLLVMNQPEEVEVPITPPKPKVSFAPTLGGASLGVQF